MRFPKKPGDPRGTDRAPGRRILAPTFERNNSRPPDALRVSGLRNAPEPAPPWPSRGIPGVGFLRFSIPKVLSTPADNRAEGLAAQTLGERF